MRAIPVGVSTSWSRERSTSAALRSSTASGPNSSSPTAPTKLTSAPRREAATAWFAPLPPGTRLSVASLSVSPGLGRNRTRATRSRLTEPTTVIRTSRSKRAQIFDGPVQEVLAEVEEPGPERRAVGNGGQPNRRREALQSAHEDGELEIGVRDPRRGGADAGALEDGLPFDDLAGSGLSVPRAAVGLLRLQLQQETPQRALQAGECGLGPLGGPPEGRLALRGGAGLRLASGPALEEAAEGEGCHLARRQRANQAARRGIRDAIGAHQRRPAGPVRVAHLPLVLHQVLVARTVRPSELVRPRRGHLARDRVVRSRAAGTGGLARVQAAYDGRTPARRGPRRDRRGCHLLARRSGGVPIGRAQPPSRRFTFSRLFLAALGSPGPLAGRAGHRAVSAVQALGLRERGARSRASPGRCAAPRGHRARAPAGDIRVLDAPRRAGVDRAGEALARRVSEAQVQPRPHLYLGRRARHVPGGDRGGRHSRPEGR